MHSPAKSHRYPVVLIMALISLAGCDDSLAAPEAVICGAPSAPPVQPGDLFYEIFDLQNGTVWGTIELAPDEFANLELPMGWAKNQIREGTGASGQFVRTPGCENDGEYTEEILFGTLFQHVVDLVSTNQTIDEAGLLRLNRVLKYHQLTFSAGQTVTILDSPEQARYIMISRDSDRETDDPTLPNGWSLTNHTLTDDLDVELFGTIDNIRADNEDSFQGPLPLNVNL